MENYNVSTTAAPPSETTVRTTSNNTYTSTGRWLLLHRRSIDNKSDVNFTLTADSGASGHFIDSQLPLGIEQRMLNYVHLDPPVAIQVAGGHRLSGVGKGVYLVVKVEDQRRVKHPVQLPATIAPRLGHYLFSGGTAVAKGVSMIIATKSH